ncbi:hypothetical protein N806_27030 [Rhodococcus sp. P27]|nr:hypothetical protein N806_27030 [Rhodococcus sp. P27]
MFEQPQPAGAAGRVFLACSRIVEFVDYGLRRRDDAVTAAPGVRDFGGVEPHRTLADPLHHAELFRVMVGQRVCVEVDAVDFRLLGLSPEESYSNCMCVNTFDDRRALLHYPVPEGVDVGRGREGSGQFCHRLS